MLENFHTSLELAKTFTDLKLDQFSRNIRDNISNESELIIDPLFFYALAKYFPRISHVEVRYKHSKYKNEMTCYRYDVILHLDGVKPLPIRKILDWQKEKLSINSLEKLIDKHRMDIFAITNIPNSRVIEANYALEILSHIDCERMLADLRLTLQNQDIIGIDPQLFFMLKQNSHEIEIIYSSLDPNCCFDVVFVPKKEFTHQVRAIFPNTHSKNTSALDWNIYANQPLNLKQDLMPKNYLQGEVLGCHLNYWREYLSAFSELLLLPTDKLRPRKLGYKKGYYQVEVCEELLNQLQKFSLNNDVTSDLVLLAVFKMLLCRYSGQEDVCVGVSNANFINILPVRSDLNSNLSFRNLLTQLQKNFSNLSSYQNLPFQQLVENLYPVLIRAIIPSFKFYFRIQKINK